MLRIVDRIGSLDMSKLEAVYEQTIIQKRIDPDVFISGLYDFFQTRDAMVCILEDELNYLSALRLEPYRNGCLISWLETQKTLRGNGYATTLVDEVIRWCADRQMLPVYAHVHKSNLASVRVFENAGFLITGKPAVFLDGSVYTSFHTLKYDKNVLSHIG